MIKRVSGKRRKALSNTVVKPVLPERLISWKSADCFSAVQPHLHITHSVSPAASRAYLLKGT